MKKTMIFAAIAAAMTFSSCDDFLSEELRGTENIETYFQTADDVNSYVLGCYFQLDKYDWWQVSQVYLLEEMMTDNAWDGNTQQEDGYREVSHFYPTAPNNGILTNFWGARYQGIASCNTGIERVPGVEMNERQKNIRLAEMRFLRAFYYFDLVKNFGGVPLITTPMASAPGITRNSLEECYAFIEKELSDVAEILPQKSEYGAADMGRATRGAALGFLGKAQLYQGKFAEAKATLWKVIEENEYKLMDNFGDVWSVRHNNNAESIFEIQTKFEADPYNVGGCLTVISGCRECNVGDGWAWGQPSADLENAYIAAGDTERLRWTIIKTGDRTIAGETRMSDYYNANKSKYVGTEAYKNYCKPVSEGGFGWASNTATTCFIADPSIHKSARIIRKFYVPVADRPEVYNIRKVQLNNRLLRYADVLLMYAEACNETNDDGNARTYLNKVRNRVGLGDVTSSGDELRQAIRLERRLELAFESNRLYDIRRWKDANGKTVMENLFGPNGSFVKYNTGENADMYEKANQGESSDKGIRFQAPRDLIWPIPVYEIEHSNYSITQNPGW